MCDNTMKEGKRVAYAFYATDYNYGCSALVNMELIRNVHNSAVPFILIVTPSTPESIVNSAKSKFNAIVELNEPPALHPGGFYFYSQVLTKLLVFQMYKDWDRIIILDSDQLVRTNLDHLFELPSVDIAMPNGYWMDKGTACSTMIVLEPSERMWKRVKHRIDNIQPNEYDMDLLNSEFSKEIMLLPGRYATLNSHWEGRDVPIWSKRFQKSLDRNQVDKVLEYVWQNEVAVLHFTARGKPWHFHEELLEDGLHPLFAEQFKISQRLSDQVCPK